MSKQRNNLTAKSKNTEDDAISGNGQSIDQAELEQMLKSFNDETTKRQVCKQIKTFEAMIETEVVASGSVESQEDAEANKTQKITLPLSGCVIQAQGNSLKLACELVEAWGRQTKTLQTGVEGIVSHPGSRDEQPSQDSIVQKFSAVQ